MGHYQTLKLGMTFEETIEAFLQSRRLGNGGANKPNAERTIYEYRYDLETFFRFFEKREHYTKLAQSDITAFLVHHQGREIADASKKKMLRSLRAFFNWVEKDSECQEMKLKSWAHLLPKIGQSQGRLYIPTPEVMSKFLHAFDTSTIWGLRDFTVTSMLIDCGPRIGEVCNLDISSLLFDQNQMILNGKTGQRVVPLSADITIPHLRKWLRERKRFAKCEALFTTKFGGRCTPNTFDQAFADNRKISGVGVSEEGTLTPHTVRHYFCTHYLVNGGSLPMLQSITGHTNLMTLQIYLHMSLQFASVKKEHMSASPLRSMATAGVKKRKMF